jgi:uncharacterized SAM-binding protein YcdF (DUF218 family)
MTMTRPIPIRVPRHGRRRLLLAASAIILIALLWPLSQAGRALIVTQDLASPDAILMLASHEWERLPAVAALARKYPRAIVLLTVPSVITERNCHRCRERTAWLNAEGIGSARVVLLPRRAMNTYQEAEAAREFVTRSYLSRLLVVTSPYHTKRVSGTFRHVFSGTSVALGTVAANPARGNPARWWSSAYDRYYVRYEWAALLKYRLVHGVPLTAGRT